MFAGIKSTTKRQSDAFFSASMTKLCIFHTTTRYGFWPLSKCIGNIKLTLKRK